LGDTASTPGTRSMTARCRAGSRFAMETLLRTMTRNAEAASSGGTVISRSATWRATSRNRLTATLRMERVARRLLRKAFFKMKVLTVTMCGGEDCERMGKLHSYKVTKLQGYKVTK